MLERVREEKTDALQSDTRRAKPRDACVFRTVSGVKKVLQNTGPVKFRQSGFLDFRRTPGYNFWFLTPGGVAQLGERLNGIQEVRGSIPLSSTTFLLFP